ncbi:MAG: hypothetical protein ACI8PZ_005848 [Myxococcota bacterium]|jgi:hypothetical protein
MVARRAHRLILGCALAMAVQACGGDTSDAAHPDAADAPTEDVAPDAVISDAFLDRTWVVEMASEEAFQPYANKAGWVTLLMKRNYEGAAKLLDSDPGGLAGARVHADMAAMYRQAALLSANSLIQVYGETPEDTDPVGVAHLLTVAYAINGRLDDAKAQSARLTEVKDDPTGPWHEPWKAWLGAGDPWPPDLSDLPLDFPASEPGTPTPSLSVPHYELHEQGVDSIREMADPGALVALAHWHDAVGASLAGDAAGQLDVYRAGYRLPVEAAVTPGAPLSMEFLFGSDLLVGEDGPFLAELHGPAGAAAVDTWKDRSLLAAIAHAGRVDGKMDAERTVDIVSELRNRLLERSKARTEDTVQGHQRTFSDIAFVGMLRSLALVAEIEGDREVSGRLRINALERAGDKSTACPTGLVALAAWDASNRYPTRALDIVHVQSRRFPALEAARYGLDAMALRVSRERPGETAGM